MKTTILTFATIATIVLGIGTKSFAADKNDSAARSEEVGTVLTDVTKINKIEVYGNVEVYVSNDENDQVKVYNRYYSESALLQSRNGVLRISSYAPKKLVVWVKAADLRSISAYDNAEIKSFGKFSQIALDVNLHNNASAQLNLDAFSAKVTVTDHAKADLSGIAQEFTLNRDVTTSVNKYNLVAAQASENTSIPANNQDVATL
jgi:putative autotransporter adhesin-like protein